MAPESMFQIIRKVHTGKTHVPAEIAVHLAEHLSDGVDSGGELEVSGSSWQAAIVIAISRPNCSSQKEP